MKRLNILDLHRSMNERKLKRTACFEKVLENCHKKIKASAANNKYKIYYEVPDYMMGYPLYDLNECIKFVVDSLNRNGFLAVYYFPRYVYVSWDFEEIESAKKSVKNATPQQILDPRMQVTYKPSGKLALDI